MHLTCPKCGGERIVYAGTTMLGFLGGYRSTDARYTCKDCGYTGPLIVDILKEDGIGLLHLEEKKRMKLPIFWVLILGLISLLAISFGERVEIAILFFLIFSSILGLFFYFVKEDEYEPVENDLEKLDEKGMPKE
jgi:predicted RNA-binding Zn-ribbon protein involved in translation (DUF1610 family)